MTLEDIAEQLMQESMKYGIVDTLKKRYAQSKKKGVNVLDWNSNEVEMLIPFAYGDLAEDEVKILRNTPTRELHPALSKAIEPAYDQYTKSLASIVEPEYSTIINTLGGDALLHLLIETSTGNLSDEKYKEIVKSKKRSDKLKKISEDEDAKGYREFIKGEYEAFAKVLNRVKNDEEIKTLVKSRANYEVNRFLSNFANDEGQIDEEKARAYLSANIGSLEGKDKEKAYAIAGYEVAKAIQASQPNQ
jgi:hypothetical protein